MEFHTQTTKLPETQKDGLIWLVETVSKVFYKRCGEGNTDAIKD